MNYQEALEYIHSVCWRGSIPGLSRTRELLRRIGDPHKKLKFVHIAGTNGKGSTASMLSSAFRAAGYKTGLYTSPYIIRFNERMQINGEMIPDEELSQITEMVKPFADTMEDRPTEFELVTVIAMEYFARNHCDIVILEVGMGGEFDSTNVIDCPEASVIVNIGLDHTGVLGETLEEIAQAKAGIIKGGDVVLYRSIPSVEQVFEDKCRETGACLHRADFDSIRLHDQGFWGQCFDCGGREKLELPLLGEHQRRNTAVVLATVDVLRQKGWSISEEQLRQGLKTVSWPGRFELLRREPVFFADGGHNPQCMEALAENIRSYLPNRALTALVGVMADKDHSYMTGVLSKLNCTVHTVRPDNPRALDSASLADEFLAAGVTATAHDSFDSAVSAALCEAKETSSPVIGLGSLYMYGDFASTLRQLLL
ncbi:MAG: bifunctional folylpolyglutamate synthase/dihydrofolate synthase [Oscillospiraceae bacterium]|nr:bifunctional folylpolyglutamate synthase/dihydrofolate synthase [Oscillospiraceae bacterium]